MRLLPPTSTLALVALVVLLLVTVATNAFVQQYPVSIRRQQEAKSSWNMAVEPFEVSVSMPPSDSDLQARMKIDPILDVPSEIVEVRYKVPFGLNVEPRNNLAVCTKDGEGGEREGDVLRFSSAWTMGLPRGDGLITTAASFAGGLQWQCSMFDVMKSKSWDEVVEALTSNVESRTDEVVLLFERPLES